MLPVERCATNWDAPPLTSAGPLRWIPLAPWHPPRARRFAGADPVFDICRLSGGGTDLDTAASFRF